MGNGLLAQNPIKYYITLRISSLFSVRLSLTRRLKLLIPGWFKGLADKMNILIEKQGIEEADGKGQGGGRLNRVSFLLGSRDKNTETDF